MTGKALIGHTGFVGSTLNQGGGFDACFNSSTIGSIRGQSFDHIVCAGISAVKWWANKNPAEDLARIESLIADLSRVEAARFTLISTVDVYGRPVGVTEDDVPDREGLHPYGLNRLRMEDFVAERFANHHIVRLPALFGRNLKKNAIYDLMHDNNLAAVNPAGSFQWYPLARLSDDLARIEAAGLRLINVATQPVTMAAIRDRFFPGKAMGAQSGPAGSYDFRTRHAALLGGQTPYVMTADAVLAALGAFLDEARPSLEGARAS